jgi:hypothetical protein
VPEQGLYDAGDQTAVDNAAKETARREAQDHESIRIWMSHPHGRDLIWRFLETCHMQDDCRGSDTHDTYFNLGERNVGNWWLSKVLRHPKLYMEMVEEQNRDRELRNTRLLKQNERKDGGEESESASAFPVPPAA